MTKEAITTATPCAALRASLPGRGQRQISVFLGKTSGRRARRRVFRDVFVEDVTQEEKKFIKFIFLPAASSTRRLRAAADWGSWRTSSLKTHGGSCRWSCLGSTRGSARRLARAPLGRLRCYSTEHSEGVPLLPRTVLSGRRPRRGAWHINFACGGRGSPRRRQALPAARGTCVAPAAAPDASRALGGGQPRGWP